MENGKKRSAIASKIPGLMDGGRANPAMLGWGAARGAGAALAGRSGQVRNAIDAATGSAPVRAIAAPAGKGGMSRIRDGATPPAHMLAAQRRGMKDGGSPKEDPLSEAISLHESHMSGAIKPTMASQEKLMNLLKIHKSKMGMKDGDMKRGNAAKIETGDGGAVRGPGGPTDDQVGPVALSNTEYVLPGDTVEAMGGEEALDKIRDETHTFVEPKNNPAIARGMNNGGPADKKTPWKSEFAKDKIPTMSEAMFGTRPATPSRPVGETIGAGARVAANGAGNVGEAIGQAARNLETTGQGALSVANNLPGAIAAPIANAVDSFGASIRTGYTGEKYAGREFVGKPLFDGSAQAAAPAAAQPDMGAQLRAKNDAILNGDNRGMIDPTKVSAGDRALMERGGAQAAPAAGTQGMPSMPTIGKVNVSRQPNGVMSFSGKDQVDGYAGTAAGQLKGGGSSGAVTPADYQAAIARGEKDKAGVVSMAASYAAQGDREGAARMAAGDPAATAAAEQAFQQRELRIAALNGNKNAAAILNNQGDNETARLRIASDLAPKPETAYDRERTRGAKADNDRAAVTDSLIGQYMNAPDDKTRNAALERLNALGGKNGSEKRYMRYGGGTDDMGVRQPDGIFDTQTGRPVSAIGSGGGQQGGYPEGTRLTGPDGKAYVVKDGAPVLVG